MFELKDGRPHRCAGLALSPSTPSSTPPELCGCADHLVNPRAASAPVSSLFAIGPRSVIVPTSCESVLLSGGVADVDRKFAMFLSHLIASLDRAPPFGLCCPTISGALLLATAGLD